MWNESKNDAVRSTIIQWITDDVIGPRNGPEEELVRSENPTQSYLSGILFSKMSDTDPEEDEQEQVELEGGESDDDPQEERVNMMANLKQSSFGLTCTVPNDANRIRVHIEYGTYDLVPKIGEADKTTNEIQAIKNVTEGKDAQETTKGTRKPMVYKRTPHSETHVIQLDTFAPQDIPLGTNKKFALRYYTKKYEYGRSLSVFVLNNHIWDGSNKDEFKRCMFQPKITLSAHDGDRIFMDSKVHGWRNINGTDKHDRDDSALFDMLFRKRGNFATGHGCAVQWDEDAKGDRVGFLKTTFVPKHTVPKIRPREMDADGLDMGVLSRVADMAEYRKLLSPVADEYEIWITSELEAKAKTLAPEFQEVAMVQIKECRNALGRIRRGIEIVSTNKEAAEAFGFANRAMYLQMSYGRWARENVKKGRVDEPKPKVYGGQWRPFQIAFFLMNIDAITDPRSEYRSAADLLWFATGGGKTEAYLGIIAFTVAHRRLRHDIEHMKYGTAVMMRYTLRLLTLQQFHRAATLMCGCEYIRRKDPNKWGGEPFLVGLWVGSSTTPNTLNGDYGASNAIKNARYGNPPREHNPLQVVSCPWCGKAIDAFCYEVSGMPKQCRVYCPNKQCTFSKTGKNDTNLPVLVVDEDVYKRCPSLLIGTVDKFAQMARKWETGAIFGRVNKYCQKHGFVTDELVTDCNKHIDCKPYMLSDFGPPQLEPPELIIQDELHLIAGPLGTLTGHYETAVDLLCTGADGIRPKIIASTATTRGAPEQIRNLFNRNACKIFPPQGIDFGQSFFAEEVSLDEDPGKVYLGICTTARSRLTILGRISADVLRCVRSIKEGIGQNDMTYEQIDPYYTLVSYFNTLRELGGASKMYDDTVPRYIQRLFNNFEDQDNEDDRYRDQHLEKVELTSRIDSNDIPEMLKRLERKLDDGVSAEDLLLCTNMLSVGVDISRLGVMIVSGQPKNHSEYIQATGRIGRKSPGLIVTSYNPIKPRDLSHYENFGYYHSTLHKNVEPVNLTPFASRARDRALFGMMVSLMRLSEKRLADNDGAGRFNKKMRFVSNVLEMIRKELTDRVGNIDPSEQSDTIADLNKWIDQWDSWSSELDGLKYKGNQHEKARKQETYYLLKSTFHSDENGLVTVLDSLRDAEESIRIRYLDDSPAYSNDAGARGGDT